MGEPAVLAKAENLGEIKISLINAGPQDGDYCCYTLQDAMISSFSIVDHEEIAAYQVVEIGISFTRLDFRVVKVGDGGNVQAGWDFFANKPA